MAVIQEHRRLRRWYHEKIRAAVAIEITDDWDTFGLLERTRSIFLEHTPAPAHQQSAASQVDVNDSIPVHIFCPYKLPATGDQFDRCPVGIEPEALGKAALSIPQKQAHETFARRSTPPLNDREIHIPV